MDAEARLRGARAAEDAPFSFCHTVAAMGSQGQGAWHRVATRKVTRGEVLTSELYFWKGNHFSTY